MQGLGGGAQLLLLLTARPSCCLQVLGDKNGPGAASTLPHKPRTAGLALRAGTGRRPQRRYFTIKLRWVGGLWLLLGEPVRPSAGNSISSKCCPLWELLPPASAEAAPTRLPPALLAPQLLLPPRLPLLPAGPRTWIPSSASWQSRLSRRHWTQRP